MKKISEHISYSEAVRSYTGKKLGLDNTPNEEQLANMKLLAEKIFEPVRKHFNVPIYIWSMFRSKTVNEAIGGSRTSQHLKGQAVDIDGQIYGGVTNSEIFDYIVNNLIFDQIIAEFPDNSGEPNWVHVSYRKNNNRRKITLAEKTSKGKTIYKNIEWPFH